jgi:hypothetical protein
MLIVGRQAVELKLDGSPARALSERALTAFQKKKLTTGSTGQLVVNPLAGCLRQLETGALGAEAEFGMTPLSRLKPG